MTRDDAKEYLLNMFDSIGTTAVEYWTQADADKMRNAVEALEVMPTVDIGGVLERNIDNIRQAGLEGKEFRFRIGGRLFAVRELSQ